MLLDIVEEYMKARNYKYLRLDGQTPVQERYAQAQLCLTINFLF